MALAAGSLIGPYEVRGPLGAGGMGEVYRALDPTLAREVAIKILPPDVSENHDRIVRFRREAQVLAGLNHPHIAQVYGFEQAGGTHALVMELVEGPTLATRIGEGPIPVDEALAIARQIAQALESAHEHGIVHRDLKPANIKLRHDGTVKVLDFGLAKFVDQPVPRPDGSLSPTITSPAVVTGAGVLLGTAAYMAPEQARGKAVDRRADVWAFGCVLYEMLAGCRAFGRDEVTDTIAAIMTQPPDWPQLPASTPAAIRTLLRRCLEKDRARRLPDIGAARLEIEEALAAPAAAVVPPPAPASRIGWIAAGLAALAAGGLAVLHFTETDAPRQAVHLTLQVPIIGAIAPDGRSMVYPRQQGTQASGLMLRRFADAEPREIPGTSGAAAPFWSPDGQSIGYVVNDRIWRTAITGGEPQLVAELPQLAGGISASWGADGTIIFAPATEASGLYRADSSGGEPQALTTPATGEVRHTFPWFLPDGRQYLFFADTADDEGVIKVGSLGSDASRVIVTAESRAVYAAGHLLFVRRGDLMAQPFDPDRAVTTGDSFLVARDMPVLTGGSTPIAASASGTIAYRSGYGLASNQLVILNRQGAQIDAIGGPADQTGLQLSPDGTRLVVSVFDEAARNRDIWMHDLTRGLRTKVTFDPGDEWAAAWSPDGLQLAVSAWRQARMDLFVRPADGSGTERFLLGDIGNKYVTAWTTHGVLFWSGYQSGSGSGNDIWLVPAAAAAPAPARQLLGSAFNETSGDVSPDGAWLAYISNESGQFEVYVTAFPDLAGKIAVSGGGGGVSPLWSSDGTELFFFQGDALMAVSVKTGGPRIDVGPPRKLFDVRRRTQGYRGFGAGAMYDVFPGSQRFVVSLAGDARDPLPVHVVIDWSPPAGTNGSN